MSTNYLFTPEKKHDLKISNISAPLNKKIFQIVIRSGTILKLIDFLIIPNCEFVFKQNIIKLKSCFLYSFYIRSIFIEHFSTINKELLHSRTSFLNSSSVHCL